MIAERCHEPFDVPVTFVELAVALSARAANAGSLALAVQCEYAPHTEGEHAVHVMYVDDVTGRAAWVLWGADEVRVQLKDACPDRDSRDEICVLFAGHPGDHLWPESPERRSCTPGDAGQEEAATRARDVQ